MATSLPTPTPDTDPNFLPLPNRRKVVIRDLPPALTEDQLLADLERLGISKSTVDYFHFVPGHIPKRNIVAALHMGGSTFHFDPATAVGGKRPRPGQCYLQFKTPEEPVEFAQQYNGHVFVDSRGVQYPVRVEYALYQKVPADWADEVKANPMEGTWQETQEFKQWMEMKEQAASKAKEPVVFDIKSGAADDVPEPPKNALLSKVAKNAQKLLAKARTKANPGGSEPLAASVPVGPSPVAVAIFTPKGPKTTPLIEYLKQQRELKLKKAKGSASAGSSPRAANLAPGKQVANIKQQGSSRPGSPASTAKPAAGAGKDAAAATSADASSDKKAKIKEQLKEKRKEKDRERRERKKAERAAAKAAGKASLSTAESSSGATPREPAAAKLPTPATSKKAADKLKKEMAAFTPTGIQKRVTPVLPAPTTTAVTATDDDGDQTPVLPFNLIQMSSSSSTSQRASSPPPRIASHAASPASVSSTAAQRGSSPAPSMLSVTSNMLETQANQPDAAHVDDADDDKGDKDEQQQDQSNLSPEERARQEKLRIKREKRKEKVKEKRKAERVAAKEAKKAARATAAATADTADGSPSAAVESAQDVGTGEAGPAGDLQYKEEGDKQRQERKKKRERPVKKDKAHPGGGDSPTKSAEGEEGSVSAGVRSSANESNDSHPSSNPTDTQPSWANNDTDQTTICDFSSTSPSSASRPGSSTPSARGGSSARGANARGGARGNRRGSVASNPPKSPPMQPAKAPAGQGPLDWATANDDAAGGNNWAVGAQQQKQQQARRDSQDSLRGGRGSGRGGALVRGRGGRGGFVPRNDVRPAGTPAQGQGASSAEAAADWTINDHAGAADWNTSSSGQQQPRRESVNNARGGNTSAAGRAGGGAAAQAMGEFASVSDWAAASGGGSDWANAELAAGSGCVDWAGAGDVPDSNAQGAGREPITATRGGRGGFGRGGRGGGGEFRGGRGGIQGDFRGGRGGGGVRGGFRGDQRGGRGRGGSAGGPNREAHAPRSSGGGDAGAASSTWMNE